MSSTIRGKSKNLFLKVGQSKVWQIPEQGEKDTSVTNYVWHKEKYILSAGEAIHHKPLELRHGSLGGFEKGFNIVLCGWKINIQENVNNHHLAIGQSSICSARCQRTWLENTLLIHADKIYKPLLTREPILGVIVFDEGSKQS